MASFAGPKRSLLRIRLFALAATFVFLLAFLVQTLYTDLSARGPILPVSPARAIPNTDVNPYGANFFLTREVEPWKIDKTLQMAAEAGIGWVKQQFPWEEIEPLRKGEFLEPTTKGSSWAKYDQIVAACEKYGLQIVARLDRPPDWSRQDNTYKERPPDNFEDYGDFVYTFVKRYQGRINYIQIWNEPNIFPEWGNQPVDPAQYVELLKIAYRRAKEANPNVHVLSAPLAYTLGQPHPEPDRWISMNDLDFLEGMYKAGAKDYFDIYSANAFGMSLPPDDPPDEGTLNFQRVVLQHNIMERYDDRDKAVWFNEYGWNAAPESLPADKLIWGRVSEKQQAEYALRGIQIAREQWPWAGVFMVWYFRQVGNFALDDPSYYFRMVDTDFTPRLVYSAIQDVAGREEIPGPGLYQETHPSVATYGHWENVIDNMALDKGFIRSSTPGDSVTFTFRGPEVDLLTRRWAGSGRLLVSLDGRSVPGLAVDERGLSYVDLYSPSLQERARVLLVRDLAAGEHTLRLTVAEQKNSAATGNECILDAFEVVQGRKASFPLGLVAGTMAALGANGWFLWRTWRRGRWGARSF